MSDSTSEERPRSETTRGSAQDLVQKNDAKSFRAGLRSGGLYGFRVLFPRRKAQKFVITPKMLQLCALYDSASVVQWIE